MRRRTTASALAAVVLCAGLSTGQPPTQKAPADPTDALIQKALANDPDVQVARAKLALAEAEVAKARQSAVARVLSLRYAVDQQQRAVAHATEAFRLKEQMGKAGQLSREEMLIAGERLGAAQSALERAETELRLLTGDGPKATTAPNPAAAFLEKLMMAEQGAADDEARAKVLRLFAGVLDQARVVQGPIPDRIRAALDKKVRLGGKGDGISLDAAMEVFKKEAGLDVPIRPTPSPMPRIVLNGEELPIGAWFQMFQDHGGQRDGFAFYVRDYGLLVANRQTAPPDAITLTEFWRARAVAAQKAPEPKLPAREPREIAHDKLPAVLKAKVSEVIVIPLPVKTADVEMATAGSNGAILAAISSRGGGVVVVIQTERAGKARVSWDVTDATGRRFTERGREVEFE